MSGYWHPEYEKLPSPRQDVNRPEAVAACLRGKRYTLLRNLLSWGVLLKEGGEYALNGNPQEWSVTNPDVIHPMVNDWTPIERWFTYRQVLAPDPYLTAALLESTSSHISGDALRSLPLPNPLFVLPEGVNTALADGSPGRITAFHISGARSFRYGYRPDNSALDPSASPSGSLIVDTTDPKANALHVCVLSEVFNDDHTQVINHDVSHLTLPLVEDFTITSLAERIIRDGYRFTDGSSNTSGPQLEDWLRTAIHTVVPHLLYAVSDKLEVDREHYDLPPAARRIPGEKKPVKPCRMHYAGARLGAAIRAWKYTYNSGARETLQGSGRTVAPHIRGAHFHTYRVGPGRKEPRVKFLLPTTVNMHLDDGTTTTIRPVR